VSPAEGGPSTSTWIELLDASGRVERREEAGPTFRICDFSFGPHTLRIGVNECLPVAVSNLRVVIGQPLNLHVLTDGCGYMETMRNACLLYFRARDEGGKPVPQAQFSVKSASSSTATDSFGRWQGLFRGSDDFTFTAPGYASATVHAQCQAHEEVDLEVVMKRAEVR